MHSNPQRSSPAGRRRTRGVAMILVLMFLLAVTGIAVFSARYALFGEGMARNQLEYEVARQAAEAALRDAERDLRLIGKTSPSNATCARALPAGGVMQDALNGFSAACTQGQCLLEAGDATTRQWTNKDKAEPWWPESKGGKWNDEFDDKPEGAKGSTTRCDFTGGVPLGTFTGVPRLVGVVHQPEYLIERLLGPSTAATPVFRITARGFGYTENTQVVLQSYFVPPEK